ncbi:MAG TPA: HNH endonuclease, partial [Steroidobacteraceae bacterium]|nr:HNH endonuclease [Steroidobacteraceae bacterium]
CDASVVRIIEDADGEPLDVGRKTRTIPPAIRRALHSRDKGCRFPGCTHTRFVDGHHIQHWSDGGETKLSNLVLLCRFHHRLVHEGGVDIERLDDGAFRFVHPDGRSWSDVSAETHPRQTDWTRIPELNREHRIAIDSNTARTRWLGETMDYGLAVDALLQRRRTALEGVRG